MASAYEVINRWVEQVGTDKPRFLRPQCNIVVDEKWREQHEIIYSYGHHFELARLVGTREKGFFLINSTKYSSNTSKHQGWMVNAVNRSGIQALLLPYASLDAAHIVNDSIKPIDIAEDEYIREEHHAPRLEDVPEGYRVYAVPDGDRYRWTTSRHLAGGSVFQAKWRSHHPKTHETVNHIDYFVSSFDDQETNEHYFLAQLPKLPKGVKPMNIKDALYLLRPFEVLRADAAGHTVIRQGDIFGVSTSLTTQEIHKLGGTEKMGRLLGTSHVATEVVVTKHETFARGCLYHRPDDFWRAPEHKRQKLGNGKTWHVIAKNLVPEDRSWSVVGRID